MPSTRPSMSRMGAGWDPVTLLSLPVGFGEEDEFGRRA